MSRPKTVYRVFISSPSDLSHERQQIKELVHAISRGLEPKRVAIEPWIWEENTVSQYGATPQAMITGQLEWYDAYIGLMGGAFGSPTEKYGSGTEEEFENAANDFEVGKIKDIAFFFKNVAIESGRTSARELEQLSKVIEFKSRIGAKLLYKEFSNDASLQNVVSEFLLSFINKMDAMAASSATDGDVNGPGPLRANVSDEFVRDFLAGNDQGLLGSDYGFDAADLWIEPDLKSTIIRKDTTRITEYYDLNKICQGVASGTSFHITGQETSGKSTISARLFMRMHSAGHLPVYISGSEIKYADETRILNRIALHISQQYQGISQDKSKEINKKNIVVIIDDFDLVPLNTKTSLKVLKFLKSQYLATVITTSASYSFSILEAVDDVSILGDLKKIDIQELSQKKRYELIENWYRLMEKVDHDDTKFRHQVERARKEVNRVLLHHIVPRTPIIVLILLKAIENRQSSDLAQTGYVRYYKFLIDNAILKNLRATEVEQAYALLPELAWAVYNSSGGELSQSEVEKVVENFSERRALRKASLFGVLASLRAIGMFSGDSEVIRFKYQYAFNFFLADYISQNISSEEMRDHIRVLCQNAWSRQTTTILVFLSFHSNDSIITESLLRQLREIYPGQNEFEFTSERTASINKLMTFTPSQAVDHTNVKENRNLRLDTEEEIEAAEAKRQSENPSNSLNGIERVMASVEVLGHILRNHYARLDAEPKRVIYSTVMSAILRCLENFYHFLVGSQELLVSYIARALKMAEGDPERQDELARALIFLLAMGLLYFFMKRLSQAVGDENLEITYKQAVELQPVTAQKYFDLVIKLDCFYKFPEKELEEVVELLKDNHLAKSALQLAVAERLDMRPPASAGEFQKYCNLIGLRQSTRLIERQRLGSVVEKPRVRRTKTNRRNKK